MGYECKIVEDSISTVGNKERLTTFEITFPRCILAEVNTHRILSRNSASSRAIPVETMLKRVKDDPYIPVFTGKQAGMQGVDKSNDAEFQATATRIWLETRDMAHAYARKMLSYDVHKQDVNRILEPWLWHTVIVSSTSWANFFTLRTHSAAHSVIQTIARMMSDAYVENEPKELKPGEWHLPYITVEDMQSAYNYAYEHFDDIQVPGRFFVLEPDSDMGKAIYVMAKMSVARCARVSYMRHVTPKTIEEDLERHGSLVVSQPVHSSSAEHAATPAIGNYGNFSGWLQYRHTLPNESASTFEWKGHIIH